MVASYKKERLKYEWLADEKVPKKHRRIWEKRERQRARKIIREYEYDISEDPDFIEAEIEDWYCYLYGPCKICLKVKRNRTTLKDMEMSGENMQKIKLIEK